MTSSIRSKKVSELGVRSICTVGAELGGQVQLWAVTSSDKVRRLKRLWSNCRFGGEAFPKAIIILTRLKHGSRYISSAPGWSMTTNFEKRVSSLSYSFRTFSKLTQP